MYQWKSSHQRYSVRKGVLRNFAKFTGKHLCQSLFFNKVAGLRPEFLLKKRFWHRCFPVNFAKFLRTPFLQNTSERLLLSVSFLIHATFLCQFFLSYLLGYEWRIKELVSSHPVSSSIINFHMIFLKLRILNLSAYTLFML